ncbi:MAG: gamma carbonic anhydrase family protein [Alphaproteobacteria bacterium]|nr:gamma carbonic anhydrase family protein [Alphaproteobacteria bacterium]
MPGMILTHRGNTPTMHDDAFIAENATLIGQVDIAADASIWYNCVLRGDGAKITVGPRTNIQDGTVIHVNEGYAGRPEMPTWIGADVTVGHMALIHACTLKDRAFVGMKACVMDGAVVEEDGFLAAGALLTPGKVVPSGELWAGAPAKFQRKLRDEEIAGIVRSAHHYVALSKTYTE